MVLSNIAGPDLVIVVFFLAAFGVYLWGLIDSLIRPSWAYRSARSSKALWVVLNLVIGFVPAIIYLVSIRPRVAAAQVAGQPAVPAWTGGAPMPSAWYPDPSGRHQLRYWDGAAWTHQVSDVGQVSEDSV